MSPPGRRLTVYREGNVVFANCPNCKLPEPPFRLRRAGGFSSFRSQLRKSGLSAFNILFGAEAGTDGQTNIQCDPLGRALAASEAGPVVSPVVVFDAVNSDQSSHERDAIVAAYSAMTLACEK